MNFQVRGLFVPVVAAALLLGGAQVSQAQSNFIDTNIALTYISTASGSPLIALGGNSVTASYAPGESYTLNGAGASDAATRDGSGAGAFIRLSVAGNGLRETSNQNAVINTSSINYRFDITIQDVTSGVSQVVALPFTFNNAFNEGSNGGDNVSGVVVPGPTKIGNNTYTFSAFAFTPASAPPVTGGTSLTDGSFGLRVQATPAAVPEPGTVAMLVGMGVSGSAFVLRKRRDAK